VRQEIKDATNEEVKELFQGMDSLYEFLEGNKKVSQFLFDKFTKIIAEE